MKKLTSPPPPASQARVLRAGQSFLSDAMALSSLQAVGSTSEKPTCRPYGLEVGPVAGNKE